MQKRLKASINSGQDLGEDLFFPFRVIRFFEIVVLEIALINSWVSSFVEFILMHSVIKAVDTKRWHRVRLGYLKKFIRHT